MRFDVMCSAEFTEPAAHPYGLPHETLGEDDQWNKLPFDTTPNNVTFFRHVSCDVLAEGVRASAFPDFH